MIEHQVVEMLLGDQRTNINQCSGTAGLTVCNLSFKNLSSWSCWYVPIIYRLILILSQWLNDGLTENDVCYSNQISAFAHCLRHRKLRDCQIKSNQTKSNFSLFTLLVPRATWRPSRWFLPNPTSPPLIGGELWIDHHLWWCANNDDDVVDDVDGDVLDDDMMMIYDDVVDHRDTEDGISPMMAAVGAGRLEVVRHLVN